MENSKIRNIAVIAHVDHGKTTLVDSFMKQSNMFRDNEALMTQSLIMDNMDLERERGITITAKNIFIKYKDYKINIIDTPGHADFSGEVERTLNMADGCLLIVDAQEGPMPQTRYVLQKALELGKKIIVVINKIDKKFADIDKTLSEIDDLFLDLATSDDQLEFPIFYAIAREGVIFDKLPDLNTRIEYKSVSSGSDVSLLFASIIKDIPPPSGDLNLPFLMQVSSIDYDEYTGSGVVGKILQGEIKRGDSLDILASNSTSKFKVLKLIVSNGIKKEEIQKMQAGDIVTIIGATDAKIGDTITAPGENERLPDLDIQEPSVRIKFEANSSPLAGREGKFVTSRQLLARLERELQKNVAMKLEVEGDQFFVSGRGELHLSILIETLRREGYEFQISKPEAITKIIDGKKYEGQEDLFLEVGKDSIGTITTALSKRKGELVNMHTDNSDIVHFHYKVLTRNLFGLRGELVNDTKGTVIFNSSFSEFVLSSGGTMYKDRKGVLIASEAGNTTSYGLNKAQERGTLFVGPEEQVYEGMIVGINKYDQDMEVNVSRAKHLTGLHSDIGEETIVLMKNIELTIELGIDFIADDEYLEITPTHLRLRKKYLRKSDRNKFNKE
ncbi:MAG: GTP-binding protein [Patescibacteria group bacterium]